MCPGYVPGLVPGMRVRHPVQGPGTVILAMSRGRVVVKFDRSKWMPKTVAARDLEPEAPDEAFHRGGAEPGAGSESAGRWAPGAGATEAGRRSVDSGGENDAPSKGSERERGMPRVGSERPEPTYFQTLEALRLGVIPADHVPEYTVGRDREVGKLERFLDDGGGLRLLWGDYGSGKTHLLDLLERLAQQKGWVTARAVLDPHEISPAHPQRLYRAFMRSLACPGDVASGWSSLFGSLAGSDAHVDPDGEYFSRFFSPVLYAMSRCDRRTSEMASDYIEGYPVDTHELQRRLASQGWRGPRPLVLSDYRTYGRVYTHMLGTLAAWARSAGYEGLLLLVDEVEYLDSLDGEHRYLTREVLCHLAAAVLPEEELAFHVDSLYKGGFDVHRRLPLRFRADQPMSAVFAFTPLERTWELVHEILVGPAGLSLQLSSSLGRGAHAALVRKVAALYARGYPGFAPSPEDLDRIEQHLAGAWDIDTVTPRDVVRVTVLALDAFRLGRDPFPPGHNGAPQEGDWG